MSYHSAKSWQIVFRIDAFVNCLHTIRTFSSTWSVEYSILLATGLFSERACVSVRHSHPNTKMIAVTFLIHFLNKKIEIKLSWSNKDGARHKVWIMYWNKMFLREFLFTFMYALYDLYVLCRGPTFDICNDAQGWFLWFHCKFLWSVSSHTRNMHALVFAFLKQIFTGPIQNGLQISK